MITNIDTNFYEQNYRFIVGIDEAGRGPLAGPVCAAAVILPKNIEIKLVSDIKDSKKLSSKKREFLSDLIKDIAVDYSISLVNHKIIDKINILEATKKAMLKALNGLTKIDKKLIDLVLIDGNFLINSGFNEISVINGDNKSLSIASASILAKVRRDQIMRRLSKIYFFYLFEKHKGYGTKEHISIIKEKGISQLHRVSFCKNIIDEIPKH